MAPQFLERVVFALQLFHAEELVNLRVTGTAQPDDFVHQRSRKLALVPFIVMPRPRNQVMTGENRFAFTQGTPSDHAENERERIA